MIRIHDFKLSVEGYHSQGKNNIFPDLFGCPNVFCRYGGRLRKHGFYQRYAVSETFVYLLFIQRYICPQCGRTVSVLPSFLAPRFQYTQAFILRVLKLVLLLEKPVTLVASRQGGPGLCFSRQHLSFYRRRLRANLNVYGLFLVSQGCPAPTSEAAVLECILQMGPERFAGEFERAWHRHFLSRL